MANGFGSLYVGASGLMSSQNALNTTANNLANVDTKGYVREQVRFADTSYNTLSKAQQSINMQQLGLGVSIGDVVHARDVFLDKAYRLEQSRSAFYSTYYEVNTQVEDLFQELDGEEFKDAIGDLWTAFQELAKTPDDTTIQNLVLQKAELFLSRSTSLYSDLQDYQTNLNTQIVDAVDKVNEIGRKLYKLNNDIIKVESGGVETAMTLRDERDNLLDELSQYGMISYNEKADGFVTVDFEGVEFIDEMCCHEMGVYVPDKSTGFVEPYWPQLTNETKGEYVSVFRLDNISTEYNTDVGKIRALLKTRGSGYGRAADLADLESYTKIQDCTVMELEAELDKLTSTIINTINDIYAPTKTIVDQNGTEHVVLDQDNCPRNKDGELPPEEIFVRIGQPERFHKVVIDGNVEYEYNAPLENDSATWYAIGSVYVNTDLKQNISQMSAFTKNGAVDYEMAERLAAAWGEENLVLNPLDTSPANFESYYDRMISNLGITGNTYKTAKETMESTVDSIDNNRKQLTGVSSDEELTHLIKYQSAYNAASRYITVISEMTELIVTGLV